jgi:hypothetical protein
LPKFRLGLDWRKVVHGQMRESLDEPVSVVAYYNQKTKTFKPHQLTWQNQDYRLGPIDFYHKTRCGDKLLHHFSMSDHAGRVYFKLCLDSTSLNWVIEEFMLGSEAKVHYASFEGA